MRSLWAFPRGTMSNKEAAGLVRASEQGENWEGSDLFLLLSFPTCRMGLKRGLTPLGSGWW